MMCSCNLPLVVIVLFISFDLMAEGSSSEQEEYWFQGYKNIELARNDASTVRDAVDVFKNWFEGSRPYTDRHKVERLLKKAHDISINLTAAEGVGYLASYSECNFSLWAPYLGQFTNFVYVGENPPREVTDEEYASFVFKRTHEKLLYHFRKCKLFGQEKTN